MEQKKIFFFGGEKISFFEKKNWKKKFGKISEKFFFRFFFSLYTSKNTGFWSSSRANIFFSKNGLHHFLGEPSGYLHAKFQKNLPSGYRVSIFFSIYTSKNTGFWSSSRANNFFTKNGLHHFLGEPSGYLHVKFQKNLPSGYR